MSQLNDQGLEEAVQENLRYMEFNLGVEKFAIPLLLVKEVIRKPELTPIPNAPSHFKGIMNLRGQVISIVDLRKKLKIKTEESTQEEAVIIVDLKTIQMGVVVNSINSVLSFEKSEVSDVPELSTQVSAKYICGVYHKDNNLTILIDIYNILDVKDLSVLKSAS